ncbi:MAG: hypothetical protein QOJ02_1409 [Acidobacteriota bacterium]|jgi:hypothetical protein|nr:hypothetical protein [Acidobacteriota bacterium]
MANTMKAEKKSIKIIKREERESAPRAAPPRRGKEDSSGDNGVRATKTVAEWVSEFQHRRRAEQARALTVLREEFAPLLKPV